jgi:hypothetical protein
MAATHRMLHEQVRTMRNRGTKPLDRISNCWSGHRGAINPMAAER